MCSLSPSIVVEVNLNGEYLASVSLSEGHVGEGFSWSLSSSHKEIEAWLSAYGEGKSTPFPPLFDLSSFSPFSQKVLEACRIIPFGERVTYAELAQRAGFQGSAARAVGSVMAKNPFPLFIPCHRVVAMNGLGGFGPGLHVKKEMLSFERATHPSCLGALQD